MKREILSVTLKLNGKELRNEKEKFTLCNNNLIAEYNGCFEYYSWFYGRNSRETCRYWVNIFGLRISTMLRHYL